VSWLLDTNTCSYVLKRKFGLDERLKALSPSDLEVSAITVAEAWAGALKSPDTSRILHAWTAFLAPFADRIIPFDDAAAREYGAIRAELERRGAMIGDRDCMIAAIARSRGLVVVTANLQEFRRVGGLAVEDWRGSA
jgi:tRNA(fMet)-specific endonuclease VapC